MQQTLQTGSSFWEKCLFTVLLRRDENIDTDLILIAGQKKAQVRQISLMRAQ